MSNVIFDEVVGTVEGPVSGQEASQPAATSTPNEREAAHKLRAALRAVERRAARLRAT